jgi:methionyl-tRNA formyltransferase
MSANGVTPKRVVLLGGKTLAIDCAELMLGRADVELVAVVPCASDDPEEPRWYPSLARYARERGLPSFQPKSANEPAFVGVLRRLQPDLLLSVFYDRILKPDVLSVPAVAAVNIHFGLLPFNRGSFPIPWAMIDGNDPGVTMHHMDPGVDTGDIIAQIAVPPGAHEAARDVYDRCTAAGRYLFEGYLPMVLHGAATRRVQPRAGGSYYRPGYPFERWIDWSQSAEQVARFVRALSFPPYPGARSRLTDREIEVAPPVWPHEGNVGKPGMVVELSAGRATIACGAGLLTLSALGVADERLPAADALRRAGCAEGSVLEGMPWAQTQAA